MEIASRSEIPSYAGGFWVPAGDTSRAGYFRQESDAHGRQVEHAAMWEPLDWTKPLSAKIAVTIEGRAVWPMNRCSRQQ